MNKYLLRFCKHGNMRFISHLDINRLFRRAIKRAEIKIAFSSGYNPHEKMNVVQPLSLGFESEGEYLEIITLINYDPSDLMQMLNHSMPEGISFIDCREIPLDVSVTNLSAAASYNVRVKLTEEEYNKIDITSFLDRPEVMILKRDKKTKKMVEKDYKNYIYSMSKLSYENGVAEFNYVVKCATNETLNPMNLTNALLGFFETDYLPENIRINRIDLFSKKENAFVSLGAE